MSVPTEQSAHWGKGVVQHQFDWKCASVYEKKFVNPIDEHSQRKTPIQNLYTPTDVGCGETDGKGNAAAKVAEERERVRKQSVKTSSGCTIV